MCAVKLGDAVVYFTSDSSKLERGTDAAVSTTKSKFGNLAGSLNTIIGGAIVGGVGAAVAGLGALGAAAVGVGQDFASAKQSISNGLGVQGAELEALGETAKRVYADNWGSSLDDVAQKMVAVRRQMSGLADSDLEKATVDAIKFSETFGQDFDKTLNSANALMSQFGLTSDQAFDFLTAGVQRGLDNSGDFLDSIGEYGVQFQDAKVDAGQFFSFLQTGLAPGNLGTDKAADAFKEFGLLFYEGSDANKEALAAMGLSWTDMMSQVESGNSTISDVFSNVQNSFLMLDDTAQKRLGAAIFGTPFEDMGLAAVQNIDLSTTKLAELAGAIDAIQPDQSLGARFEGLKRQALVALEPLGTQILGIAETAMPTLQTFVEWISGTAIPWIVELFSQMTTLFTQSGIAEAFAGYQEIFNTVMASLSESFGFAGSNLTSMEVILWAVEKVFKAVAVQIQLSGVILYGMGAAIKFVVDKVKEVIFFISQFQERLAGLQIPEFLQMHSPPPLAQALGMVKEQVEGLKNTDMPGLVDPAQQQAGPAQGAGGGGGSQTINLVVDGQVLASVVNTHLGSLAAAGV